MTWARTGVIVRFVIAVGLLIFIGAVIYQKYDARRPTTLVIEDTAKKPLVDRQQISSSQHTSADVEQSGTQKADQGLSESETDRDAQIMEHFPADSIVHAWPENIESEIWEYFSRIAGLELTNIVSVECTERVCNIIFTGTDIDPQGVDSYFSGLVGGMYAQPWNVKQGRITLRELSPGLKAYDIRISNVEFFWPDHPSDLGSNETEGLETEE